MSLGGDAFSPTHVAFGILGFFLSVLPSGKRLCIPGGFQLLFWLELRTNLWVTAKGQVAHQMSFFWSNSFCIEMM
jgi:hypothetical protein